jgi:poly(3-hydroxybutyrate) depolymerase
MLLYQLHEFWRAGLAPYTYFADAGAKMYSSNDSWLASLPGAQRTAAAFELMYRLGKDYEKPEFGIHQVEVDGTPVPVVVLPAAALQALPPTTKTSCAT